MPLFTAIGLMSGTSMDGVDVALVETDGRTEVRQGSAAFLPYDEGDRALLRAALAQAVSLTRRDQRPEAIAACETMVTERHGEAVERFLRDNSLTPAQIEHVIIAGKRVGPQ